MTTALATVLFVVVFLLIVALYLTPSVIAVRRQARSTPTVIGINVLAGWTMIGWAMAFGLAFRRGDQALGLKPFGLGCGLVFAAFVVYEVCNLIWLGVPAP